MSDSPAQKVAIVVDGDLPAGLAINTAAVISVTIGSHLPELVGADIKDADGYAHRGIIQIPIPILRGDRDLLRDVMAKSVELPELYVIDFTDTAQSCRTYDEYGEKMAVLHTADLPYIGLGLIGPKKLVNRLVGSLPLYR